MLRPHPPPAGGGQGCTGAEDTAPHGGGWPTESKSPPHKHQRLRPRIEDRRARCRGRGPRRSKAAGRRRLVQQNASQRKMRCCGWFALAPPSATTCTTRLMKDQNTPRLTTYGWRLLNRNFGRSKRLQASIQNSFYERGGDRGVDGVQMVYKYQTPPDDEWYGADASSICVGGAPAPTVQWLGAAP